MKKILLSAICAFSIGASTAQVITDTVSLGAGYANQTWYSLQNDEKGSAPKNNWDIAFDVSGFGSAIHINSITGTMLWTYTAGDTADWATLDTTGIASWTPAYNSEITWALGAFDKGMVLSNQFDLGWGVYNPVNHIVSGDSLFVIKLSSGSYKKLWIESLGAGAYTFKYDDIDGSNLQNVSFQKATYTGKNFGYYSLQTNAALDREPVLAAEWDLLFTQYTSFVLSPYTVAGVLSNNNVTVAQVNNVANVTTYNDWITGSFNEDINEIGYDWKVFAGSWALEDSLVYFVKSRTEDIWKLVFTGFGGSSNGNFIFSKEKISTVSIQDEHTNESSTLAVYPNPSNGQDVTIIYNLPTSYSKASLSLYSISGKLIYANELNTNGGLYANTVDISALTAGMYFIVMTIDGQKIQQKLIIK